MRALAYLPTPYGNTCTKVSVFMTWRLTAGRGFSETPVRGSSSANVQADLSASLNNEQLDPSTIQLCQSQLKHTYIWVKCVFSHLNKYGVYSENLFLGTEHRKCLRHHASMKGHAEQHADTHEEIWRVTLHTEQKRKQILTYR